MDGSRVQKLFKQEVESMLKVYKNFETLIPSYRGLGAGHKGEDGRFVENLIRSLLIRFLPNELEVVTGFIMRPAVKIGGVNRERKDESDKHSSQLDIIVYNSAQYPIYLRSNDTVIVPPEGVIAIISVKKTLNDADIKHELNALKQASKLCRCKNLRSPFLALVSMNNKIAKRKVDTFDWIFREMKSIYEKDKDLSFDDIIGYIGTLNHWSIFKSTPSPNSPQNARFVQFNHNHRTENHLGLQFLLTGILSVYYDPSRTNISRPGFTAFPSRRPHDRELGIIVSKLPAQIRK
ncbi:MAG: hypothetical protein IKY82_07000 [Alistipes sp.]|nr:hypothetical protein [Alistipes sp.]